MSLLTIIVGASQEINVVEPTTVINAADLQTKQMLALCRKECKDLVRRFDWQTLIREGSFSTLAAETQSTLSAASADSDFYRFLPGTMWNRTRFWQVGGPLNEVEWQQKKAAAAAVGVRNYFRIRGDSFLFFPTPTAGDSIKFEYITSKWCQSAALAAQTDWLADTDTALLDEEVIRMGVVWRFLKAKGLDYGEEFRSYEMALLDLFGPDGARDTVDMGVTFDWPMVTVPEGNWAI